MDINEITIFLGCCTVLNVAVLTVAVLFLTLFKKFIINLHSKLLGVNAAELPGLYFKYLANYKVAILVFNLIPYASLKIML